MAIALRVPSWLLSLDSKASEQLLTTESTEDHRVDQIMFVPFVRLCESLCPLWFMLFPSSASDLPHQPQHRIVKFIHHSLFQRDNRVVSDVNFFRTNLSAALRNVAKPQPKFLL
jgi:hypothetical protein